MMPDLGKYADTVLWAYSVSLMLMAVFVVVTLYVGRKVRAELQCAESQYAESQCAEAAERQAGAEND